MGHKGLERNPKDLVAFSAKVVLVIASIGGVLILTNTAFGYSKIAGLAVVLGMAGLLYSTSRRWVVWLPGVLAFGVLNSLIGLVTHHAPNNPRVLVSPLVPGLSLVFYAAGCAATSRYDAARLSAFDRCCLLLYLICAIWPGISSIRQPSTTNETMIWATIIGTVAIVVPLGVHKARSGKRGHCAAARPPVR